MHPVVRDLEDGADIFLAISDVYNPATFTSDPLLRRCVCTVSYLKTMATLSVVPLWHAR